MDTENRLVVAWGSRLGVGEMGEGGQEEHISGYKVNVIKI